MKRSLVLALALAAALPITASAHKQWLVPSVTVVAGEGERWVTVDAAVSNDLFYPDFVPVKLDNISVIAPDGSVGKPENGATLKTRSVFDVNLAQQGTYRIANVNEGLSARWGERPAPGSQPPADPKASGSLRSVTVEELPTKIPAGAKNVEITETLARIETFITNGEPTPVKPTGKGLELVPSTHPNDLFAGEAAGFQLQLDGKPAADLEVLIVRGATRYRNAQDEINVTTDANGEFSVTWPEPGMYWLQARAQDKNTSVKEANARRLSYIATLEVLPQ